MIIFDFQATALTKGTLTISGTTDNRGNSLAMVKFMSTKWPLGPVLIELSEQMRVRNLELHLEWQRRDRNVEADAITNSDFSAFSEVNRIPFVFGSLPFQILDEALQWSKEIYDLVQDSKVRRSSDTFDHVSKRRKTRASERLRTTHPW